MCSACRSASAGVSLSKLLSAVAGRSPGEAMVLVACHAPRPVLAEIEDRFAVQIQTQWLQPGPQVWQVRLHRTAEPVTGDGGTRRSGWTSHRIGTKVPVRDSRRRGRLLGRLPQSAVMISNRETPGS